MERGHDLLRTGHLRHELRIDEARRLHSLDAGGREAIAELGAHRGLERSRLVLQPVARADVADDHAHIDKVEP